MAGKLCRVVPGIRCVELAWDMYASDGDYVIMGLELQLYTCTAVGFTGLGLKRV